MYLSCVHQLLDLIHLSTKIVSKQGRFRTNFIKHILFHSIMTFSSVSIIQVSTKMISIPKYTKVEEYLSTLTNIFAKTLHISRILGISPLKHVKVDQASKSNNCSYSNEFVFRWFSLPSLYSFLFQLVYVVAALIIMFEVSNGYVKITRILGSEVFFGVTTGSSASVVSETILTSYLLQMYSFGIALYLSTFWAAPKLEVLFRRWKTIISILHATFKTAQYQPKFDCISSLHVKVVKRNKWFYFSIVPFQIWVLLTASHCLFTNDNTCSLLDIYISILSPIFGAITVYAAVLTHFRTFVSINLVHDTFKQVQFELKSQALNRNFKQVCKLVYSMRRHYKFVQSVCGPGHLILTGFYFTSAITNWIMVLSSLKGEITVSILSTSLGICVVQGVTFWSLSGSANQVLFVERIIVDLVKKMELNSLFDKLEVTFIYHNV